jgi:uncharacterized surface protein with fasciclin (FAS1) repeats
MKSRNIFKKTFLLVLVVMTFNFCAEEPEYWTEKSANLVITDFINSKPELYSEFAKLIEQTGISSQLKVRGPYTVFLPNNDAMFAYYSLKNVSSLEEFSETFKTELAYNHIITASIATSAFGLGALFETNALGDYIVTEFDGSDIIVAKYAKVVDRDIETANGFSHEVDIIVMGLMMLTI